MAKKKLGVGSEDPTAAALAIVGAVEEVRKFVKGPIMDLQLCLAGIHGEPKLRAAAERPYVDSDANQSRRFATVRDALRGAIKSGAEVIKHAKQALAAGALRCRLSDYPFGARLDGFELRHVKASSPHTAVLEFAEHLLGELGRMHGGVTRGKLDRARQMLDTLDQDLEGVRAAASRLGMPRRGRGKRPAKKLAGRDAKARLPDETLRPLKTKAGKLRQAVRTILQATSGTEPRTQEELTKKAGYANREYVARWTPLLVEAKALKSLTDGFVLGPMATRLLDEV